MDKLTIKRELKNVKRDLEYYMREYEIGQKEAYATIHCSYYLRMMLTKDFVEVEERERIYNDYKDLTTGEKK